MKTHEMISIPEAQLVKALKDMPIEEMETHAKTMIKDLGSDNYAGLMKQAMKIVESASAQDNRFELVKNLIRESVPNEAVMSDIYARLAAIMMTIMSRKFRDLMQAKG